MLNEANEGLDHVAAYLDDGLFFALDPVVHVLNINNFVFTALTEITLSPAEFNISAMCAHFLGHAISPVSARRNSEKANGMMNTPKFLTSSSCVLF